MIVMQIAGKEKVKMGTQNLLSGAASSISEWCPRKTRYWCWYYAYGLVRKFVEKPYIRNRHLFNRFTLPCAIFLCIRCSVCVFVGIGCWLTDTAKKGAADFSFHCNILPFVRAKRLNKVTCVYLGRKKEIKHSSHADICWQRRQTFVLIWEHCIVCSTMPRRTGVPGVANKKRAPDSSNMTVCVWYMSSHVFLHIELGEPNASDVRLCELVPSCATWTRPYLNRWVLQCWYTDSKCNVWHFAVYS